ncbi:fap1 adhesin-like [Cebidichthys violaceus]|uniref:fap1 adhesin-like n=1 Tax=Cebidichthys violaceus TaxID=271503 RepID=UPI0035CAEE18
MESSGNVLTSPSVSADGTDSTGSRYEERAAALQVVGKWMLSEEEKMEVQEGDRCSNILASFIDSLDDRQWESIRERMRDPLSQAHLAQVSRRIVSVVSELVAQVLVPALKVHLKARDRPEASASKSSQEEETPSKDSRSTPVMVPTMKALPEASSLSNVEQFLETATEEVISAIVKSLDTSQEMSEAGETPESAASQILKSLSVEMSSSREREKEDVLDVVSLDGSSCGCCWFLQILQKVRGGFKKNRVSSEDGSRLQVTATTYPMTVSSVEVFKELSSVRFRDTSLEALERFLMSSWLKFSLYCPEPMGKSPEPSMGAVASEILDTVVNTVNQMCEPPARKVTFPWELSANSIVSAASALKVKLREMLRRFFNSHKEASDKLEEDKEERESLSDPPSSRSDERDEDAKEGSVTQSTEAGSCESRVTSMASVVKTLLDETEQSLKRDDSGFKSGEAVLTRLEELISQDKLLPFSNMLVDKLADMFPQEAESLSRTLDPSRKAWSDSELIKPSRCPVGIVAPTDQMYAFAEEAVKRLLTSLIFPPPSWEMGHVIRVQSDASSAPDWAASAEKFEDVIGDYSALMARQVMESLDVTSAASGLQQERKKSALRFFEELPNKIRSNWRTLTNKEKID